MPLISEELEPNRGEAPPRLLTPQRLLGFTCLLLLSGILYAGLHPFHVPANQVAWVANDNAVHLGESGTLLSSGSFQPPVAGGAERSIEIWVKPGKIEDSGTLLSFFSPSSSRHLSLSQSESDLEVRIESSDAWRSLRADKMYIDNAFLDGKAAFWTATFGRSGTAVYRNGKLIRRSPLLASGSEISGLLVIGTSPIFSQGWSGVLRGLAIYDAVLDRTQIERHYQSWTQNETPVLTKDDACVALYLLNEHSGRVVHNRVRSENDLYIPANYLLIRQTVLDPVWRAFNWSRGFWQDAFVNIAGFIPFGCFFCAYFWARGLRSPALHASVLGAAVSLFIELTQTRLPTRDSSMCDVINNTLGSICGALAYRGDVRRLLDQVIAGTADMYRKVRLS